MSVMNGSEALLLRVGSAKLSEGESTMEVKQLMRHQVRICHPNDGLNTPAQIVWEDVCDCVPVVSV